MDIRRKIINIIDRFKKKEVKEVEKPKDLGDIYLKKYIRRQCSDDRTCASILNSNEALKQFGRFWGEYKADTMMMITSMEYEFISRNEFTEKELAAVKMILGNIGLFFKGCKAEHDAQVAKEQRRIK